MMLTPAHLASLHAYLETILFAKKPAADLTLGAMVGLVAERGIVPPEAGVEASEIKKAIKQIIERCDFSETSVVRNYLNSKPHEWMKTAFTRDDVLCPEAVEEIVREFPDLDRAALVNATKAYEESRRRKRTRESIETMFSLTSDAKRRRISWESRETDLPVASSFEDLVREREKEVMTSSSSTDGGEVKGDDASASIANQISKLKEIGGELAILAGERRYPPRAPTPTDSKLMSIINAYRNSSDGGLSISRNTVITPLARCTVDGAPGPIFQIEREKRDEMVKKVNERIPGAIEVAGWVRVSEATMLDYLNEGNPEGMFREGLELRAVDEGESATRKNSGFACFMGVFLRPEEISGCLVRTSVDAGVEEEEENVEFDVVAPVKLIGVKKLSDNDDDAEEEEEEVIEIKVVGENYALRLPRAASSKARVRFAVPF